MIRRQVVHRLEQIAILARRGIERNMRLSAAALLCAGPPAPPSQKMLQERQQERPELALLVMEMLEVIFGQQPGEKLLGQVLRLRCILSIASDVSVKRRSIRAAQLLQRGGGGGGGTLFGRHDDAPVRSRKPLRVV